MNLFNYATPDWAERLERGEFPFDMSKIEPHLNIERADKALAIFNRLRIPDLAGQPRNEEACGEWFKNIVRIVAGGTQKDGSQIVQTLMTLVPKKNSKSSSSAALMLTLMMISPRPNAEFVLLGPTQEVAQIAYRQCEGIILCDEVLSAKFRIRQHLKRIEAVDSGCYLQIKSLDAKTTTGCKSALTLIDEAHLMNSEEAGRVVGQLRGASAAIRESALILITTHSDKVESGWWKEELTKARKVRNGEAPDVQYYLPLTWETPQKYATDLVSACQPNVFEMTNPNINRSVSMNWLKSAAKEALVSGEQELKRFLSQHINLQVSSFSFDGDLFAGAPFWPSAVDAMVTFDWICDNCVQIAFGFDGGGSSDLSSLAVVGRNEDKTWYAATKSWVETSALSYHKNIAALLREFEAQGDLEICESGQDVEQIGRYVADAWNAGKLSALGCDPHGIASELAEHLTSDKGLPDDALVSVAQGFKLKSGWLTLERKLKQNRIYVADQPITAWAVSNCRQDKASGLVTKKSSSSKIDPLVAICTAIMVLNESSEPIGDVSYLIG